MRGLHPGCRQQRLFTGALFPETLNDQLAAFARRHKLRSEVWVPHKAFDKALKPYSVYILPNATLCDIALNPGGNVEDVMASIGSDRRLVNAQQTSNQHLLERFRDFMLSCFTPLQQIPTPIPAQSFTPSAATGAQVACGTGAVLRSSPHNTRTRSPSECLIAALDSGAEPASMGATVANCKLAPILPADPCWDTLAPFRYPLALNGSLLDITHAAKLLEKQPARGKQSHYWRYRRDGNARQQRFYFVGDTECPGRYNPYFCVQYTPHTYTNLRFPLDTSMLMRHRAVEYKYVSRMWVTLKQAEELFGTHLLPERANDVPVIYCNHFTAGLEATAFYCADQFASGDILFPNRCQLDIAVKGVRLPSTQLLAYPLLARLVAQCEKGETADGEGDDRPGSDQAMTDAERHLEMVEHRQRCEAVKLHGFWSAEAEIEYLKISKIAGILTRQCLLCHYPRPLFFSNRTLVAFDLALREGEQGVVQLRLPVRLNKRLAWCNGECWFNVSQLREPAVAQELMDNPPRHFMTRQCLHGVIAVSCCRAQLARRGDTVAEAVSSASCVSARCNSSAEWVPAYVLKTMGWRLREGARGVAYTPLPTGATFKRFPVGDSVLFSVEDVNLSDASKDWLRRYTPVSEMGLPFLRGLRQAMTLRAFERGYQSHCWLLYRTRQNSEFSTPQLMLRQSCKSVRRIAFQRPGEPHALSDAQLLRAGRFEFVNAEEVAPQSLTRACKGSATREGGVEHPDAPLSQMDEGARFKVKSGIGLSAEHLLLHPVAAAGDAATLGDTETSGRVDVIEFDDCGDVNDVWESDDLSSYLYVD
ncbi:hypothetical protein CUR178_04441 [Leishmania enriettii]|uniref:Trypanosoma Tc-38 (p38) protein domain-containing protein n=1 Tax=Leishmania enriettii TaxID=5663 RepID=A0A836GH85_LEIEN|nr:hypothetical protein CUR178_04441 [Leishmania enriettii]